MDVTVKVLTLAQASTNYSIISIKPHPEGLPNISMSY
jgi:hypothetical protein